MKTKVLRLYLSSEVYGLNNVPCYKKLFYLYYNSFIDLEKSFLFNLRLMQFCYMSKNKILKKMSFLFQKKILTKYGCCIHPSAIIGINFHVPHPMGIVIGSKVVIGDNSTIYQNCTIGSKIDSGTEVAPQPIIGDRVMVYANSLILGGVKIQNETTVGACSLIINNTEPSGVYVGIPAKRIR